jgi:mono/diheme cytochrome c family protein
MRELIAKGILVLTFAVIIGLAMIFAARHNRSGAAARPTAGAMTPEPTRSAAAIPQPIDQVLGARGRVVFDEQNCSTCHSIEGNGNPRYPLDGVGARRNPEELRMWITGSDRAADHLSPGIQKRKVRFREIPRGDLDALVAYLETLTKPPR